MRLTHGRPPRLRGYDYRGPGSYFITIVTRDRMRLFGRLAGGRMECNAYGRLVWEEWRRSGEIRFGVEPDAFVVMPDHVHGLLVVTERAGPGAGATTAGPAASVLFRPPASLPSMVAGFKASVTSRVNRLRGTPDARVWQSNYYERVIRGDEALEKIRRYITDNPAHHWARGGWW